MSNKDGALKYFKNPVKRVMALSWRRWITKSTQRKVKTRTTDLLLLLTIQSF